MWTADIVKTSSNNWCWYYTPVEGLNKRNNHSNIPLSEEHLAGRYILLSNVEKREQGTVNTPRWVVTGFQLWAPPTPSVMPGHDLSSIQWSGFHFHSPKLKNWTRNAQSIYGSLQGKWTQNDEAARFGVYTAAKTDIVTI